MVCMCESAHMCARACGHWITKVWVSFFKKIAIMIKADYLYHDHRSHRQVIVHSPIYTASEDGVMLMERCGEGCK